jgi:hypothetical protein
LRLFLLVSSGETLLLFETRLSPFATVRSVGQLLEVMAVVP